MTTENTQPAPAINVTRLYSDDGEIWQAEGKVDPAAFIEALYERYGMTDKFRKHEAGVRVTLEEVEQAEMALYAPADDDDGANDDEAFMHYVIPDEEAREMLNAVRIGEPHWLTWLHSEALDLNPERYEVAKRLRHCSNCHCSAVEQLGLGKAEHVIEDYQLPAWARQEAVRND